MDKREWRSESDFRLDEPFRRAIDRACFGQHGTGAMHHPVADDIWALGPWYSRILT
jgi:hypothetical protein